MRELRCKFLVFNELSAFLKIGSLHLTIVNDGSIHGFDASETGLLDEFSSEIGLLNSPENLGKGHSLRLGVRHSVADFYLLTDADFPYKLESMVAVLQKLMEKGGVVAGFREPNYYENVPFTRRLLSKGLRFVLENWLRLPTSDSQCGLKAFDRTGRDLFLKTRINRFLFDLEFLRMASRTPDLPVSTVAVELREGVVFSQVGWKILLTEAVNFFKILSSSH